MYYLPGIFALLVLAAGWYYLFYSPAARRLSAIEDSALNRFRIRLRRFNGIIMMLLAVAFYAACYTVGTPQSMTWVFMSILMLLSALLVLALMDLQLTRRLRQKQKKDRL